VRGIVDHSYLFGPQRGPVPPWVIPAPDWRALLQLLGEPRPSSGPP
jgi:hypothetical protein